MAKKPIYELRLGRVKAAIWQNETPNGARYNVQFQRLYKDGNKWKSSDSFGREDLPLVEKLADRLLVWMYEQAQQGGGE